MKEFHETLSKVCRKTGEETEQRIERNGTVCPNENWDGRNVSKSKIYQEPT